MIRRPLSCSSQDGSLPASIVGLLWDRTAAPSRLSPWRLDRPGGCGPRRSPRGSSSPGTAAPIGSPRVRVCPLASRSCSWRRPTGTAGRQRRTDSQVENPPAPAAVHGLEQSSPEMVPAERQVDGLRVGRRDREGLSRRVFGRRESDGQGSARPLPAAVRGREERRPGRRVRASVHDLVLDPSGPSTLYAATDRGVFVSTDGAESWSPLSAGLTSRNVLSIRVDPFDPATLYAATVGDGGLFVLTRSAR